MQIITYLTIGFILALANFIIFEDNKKFINIYNCF